MTIATESDLPAQQIVVPETEMTAGQFEVWAFAQELIRCEWVEGKIVLMAPATDWHNDLNVWLITLLSFFVEERDLGSRPNRISRQTRTHPSPSRAVDSDRC